MQKQSWKRAAAVLASTSLVALVTSALAVPASAARSAAGPAASGRIVAAPAAPDSGAPADDRLLVSVAPGTTDTAAEGIAAAGGTTLLDRVGDTLIVAPAPGAGLRATASASTSLATIPGVRSVEPNALLYGSSTPNDTYFADQYGLMDAQPGGIHAQSAWNDTPGSPDVVVGVLDSGVSLNHPDLVANLWTNRTGINGCGYGTHGYNAVERNCTPADDEGHGTHVAGIVGATGNNGRGVTGVAQRVSLMPLRMMFASICQGSSCAVGTTADAIVAIDWALAAKSRGVNLRVLQASWGNDTFSTALSAAVARANTAGVLFVTAAGNDGLDLDTPGADMFPCEDPNPNVICVGATNRLDQLATFSIGSSNFGASAVDIAAPGYQIASTVPKNLVGGCFDSEYCQFDGTSMAAPMVSGAAVDALAAVPSLSVSALKARLLASVDTPPALSGVVATGRLNVCKAIPNCDGLAAVPPTVPTNFRAQVADGSVALQWAAPDSNGNSFLISGYDVEGPNGPTALGFSQTSLTLNGLTNNQNATVRVRAFGTGGSGPWATLTVRPYAGGYVVDAYGPLHPVGVGGKTPSAAVGGPRFASGLARGVAILPTGTGGYVADGYGGLHPFAIGSGSPMPPAATGYPYWRGWDIARGVTLSSQGGGYVLDGYGGVHPFGIGVLAPPPAATGYAYWRGWDIARGITFTAAGTAGYVVDGYGGIHPFRSGSAALPATASGYAYWRGWNIARGITLVPGSGGGWVLDGWGGIHPFRTGALAPPPGATSYPYWRGWDVARGIDT